MEFLRSRLIERRTTATEVIDVNLPVNPLSHIIISLCGWNVTDEATLAEILAFLNNVQVTHRGVTVWDVQSEDLYAAHAYILKRLPTLTGRLATDNLFRSLTLIVPFGRRLFNPDECFPATKKGEFRMRIDTTIPSASLDNSIITVDAVELIGATPTHHLKVYRRGVAAPGATGESEIDLAIGNLLLAAQIRMTTVPAASSNTHGIDYAELLVDNKEYLFTAADMICVGGERSIRIGDPETSIAAQGLGRLNNIFWLDFDPTGDGQFAVDTRGKSSVKLNLNFGVNEAQELTLLELQEARGV